MDGARELRKSLTLLESQTVKQSIHTALCRLRAKTEQLSLLLGGRRAHARAERGQEEGSGDQLKSVIHYCQVHSLLKRGAIKGWR